MTTEKRQVSVPVTMQWTMPNAGRQARLKAGARHERTLAAVAWTPWLGAGEWEEHSAHPPVPQPWSLPLALQLLLQLSEKAPVRALGDDLLGGALDQAKLVEAERIEANRILGVILAPSVIGDLLQRLEGILVPLRKALVHNQLCGAVRLEGTDVGGLQERTQRPLGGDRVLPHEVAVAGHEAAKVLGPRAVHGTVHDRVPDLPRPKLLRDRRKAHEGIDLLLGQERYRLGGRMQDPIDVRVGVQAHILCHAGHEEMMITPLLGDSHGLPLQVADGPHPLRPKQLVAADVHAPQEDDRGSRVDLDDELRGKGHADVERTGRQVLVER